MRLTSDLLAIMPLRRAERAKGTLILPSTANAPFLVWGEVVAAGPGHRGERSKVLWPMTAEAGDVILFPEGAARASHRALELDGKTYDEIVFVHERDCGMIMRFDEVIPLYRRIVGHIQPEAEEIFTGKIWLPVGLSEERKDPKSHVKVRVDHVGPGTRSDDARRIPMDVKPGDTVIITKWDAWEYDLLDGDVMQGHCILDEDQILAIEDGAQ